MSLNSFDKEDQKVRYSTDWMYGNFSETTKDKQVEYELLSKSDVDWTLVRLSLIVRLMKNFRFRLLWKIAPEIKSVQPIWRII